MNLAEFIIVTHAGNDIQSFRPRIFCNDGFNMSVQAGRGLYSSPKINTNVFTELEVGFPSSSDPLLTKYAETPENPTQCVYPYVPVSIIQECIDSHGGIDVLKTFTK